MMRLYRIGNRVLNMSLLVDAEYSPEKERLKLVFSAPQPADVGDSDWTVKSYEVVLKDTVASDCWEWLACQATPSR